MATLKNSIIDINRSLWNLQAIKSKRKINSKPQPKLLKTRSLPIDPVDENWWSHAKLAMKNIRMRGYSNQQYWDKVVPVKLNVVNQRPVEDPKPPPEQYSVACQVPYDHGDKYTLHKVDPSFNISTDSLRPIQLKVIVPITKDSVSQKKFLQEPNIMQSYPAPIPRDDKYIPENER